MTRVWPPADAGLRAQQVYKEGARVCTPASEDKPDASDVGAEPRNTMQPKVLSSSLRAGLLAAALSSVWACEAAEPETGDLGETAAPVEAGAGPSAMDLPVDAGSSVLPTSPAQVDASGTDAGTTTAAEAGAPVDPGGSSSDTASRLLRVTARPKSAGSI
jgi:hypothetical protein